LGVIFCFSMSFIVKLDCFLGPFWHRDELSQSECFVTVA
jgi:hypothetical protein